MFQICFSPEIFMHVDCVTFEGFQRLHENDKHFVCRVQSVLLRKFLEDRQRAKNMKKENNVN